MKSSKETRQHFRERIEGALKTIKDSDDLNEALDIVDDLNEVVDTMALLAECLNSMQIHDMIDFEDCDFVEYNGYDVRKMYEYLSHRVDLFLGVNISQAQWHTTNHWITGAVKNMSDLADSHNWGFKVNSSNQNKQTSNKINWNSGIPPAPSTTKATNANTGGNLFIPILKDILNLPNQISVSLQSNGYFKLTTQKSKIFVNYNYVPGTITLFDEKGKKIHVYKETELQTIAIDIRLLLL